MAVFLSPIGNGAQYFTIGGLPANGGFLNTYQAGTTTPQVTYTTSAGNVANPVSIPLGTGGRPPAGIWLTSGIAYDFILTDSSGAQIGPPMLNITGIGDGVVGIFATIAQLAASAAQLAASSGASLIGWIQSGTGAVLRLVQDKLRENVSVLDFIPINLHAAIKAGTSTVDVTTYIQAAIAYACTSTIVSGTNGTSPARSIYFPDGVYLVSDGVLNMPNYRLGARFYGDGWMSSVLRFVPNLTAPSYMFNNGAAEKLAFAVFENLGFQGDVPTTWDTAIPVNANFCRQWSNGPTQAFKFISCNFAGLNSVMLCEGSNTTSENKFINCKINHIKSYVLGMNNSQTLNNEFVATDIEVILGDIFYFFGAGGGAVHVFGGSIIPLDSGGAAKSVVKIAANIIQSVNFNGSRFELRGNSKLVDALGIFSGTVNFNDCVIGMTETGVAVPTKEIVTIEGFQSVSFKGCELFTLGQRATYRLSESGGSFGQTGRILWDDCFIPPTLSDDIVFTSVYGHARAVNCHGTNVGAITTEPFIYAVDFDIGSVGPYGLAGASDANFPVKRVWFKQSNTIWPKSNGAGGSINDLTVKLPKNAIIKKIVMRKAAEGGSLQSQTYVVTNNDKTVTHATSNTGNQKDPHTITQNDIFYEVGATDNERIIRMSVTAASTGTQNPSGGYAFIEYI